MARSLDLIAPQEGFIDLVKELATNVSSRMRWKSLHPYYYKNNGSYSWQDNQSLLIGIPSKPF